MGSKHIKPELKAQIMELIHNNTSVSEAAKISGVHQTTIHKWIRFEKTGQTYRTKPKIKVIRQELPQISPNLPTSRLTLAEFVYMLKELAIEYERTKAELCSLKQLVSKWQQTAGMLNEQLQRQADRG